MARTSGSSRGALDGERVREHKALGCYGCFYVDKRSLGRGPCCTFAGLLTIDAEGRCEKRREK